MRRVRALGLAALGAAVVLVLLVGLYVADGRSREGEALRAVSLADVDVAGKDRDELAAAVDRLAERYPDTTVRVVAGKGAFRAKASELGITVDREATVDAILEVGRTGSPPSRFWGWMWSFVDERDAPVRVDVNEGALFRVVAERDPGPKRAAVEPSIEVVDGEFRAVAGKPGRGINPRDVIEALSDAAADGGAIEIDVERGPVPPRYGIERARALAEEAERLTSSPLRVRAGGKSATVPVETLREWVTATATDGGLELGIRTEEATEGLAELLPDAGEEAVSAGFRVSDGRVVISQAETGTECCAPEAADLLLEAVREGDDSQITLPLKTVEPERTEEEAQELGIVEAVGSFTTSHKGGEPRVNNIHRIADIIRGEVIEPGKTLSVNGLVGRRTRDKGFVAAPIIEDGLFTEDVGGGISQFATTFFNAAFFAGLDFGEYQSHSIYISRYPYGREATLNYPHPDLVIENKTNYGVLVWPTYTSTSITVTLYSTKHIDVSQTGQSKRQEGVCTVVTTQRTRTYRDGTKKVDSVRARYRPGEGINCNGTRVPRPDDERTSGTTATTAAPTTAPPTTAAPAPPPAAPATTAP